jgi:hypothetical protein
VGLRLEVLVAYRLAGRSEVLYALKSLCRGSYSYREVSEEFGVSQGVVENAFREVCGGRYQLCARVLPEVVDAALSYLPALVSGATCLVCGTRVRNPVLHVERKHGELVRYYSRVLREAFADALRRLRAE